MRSGLDARTASGSAWAIANHGGSASKTDAEPPWLGASRAGSLAYSAFVAVHRLPAERGGARHRATGAAYERAAEHHAACDSEPAHLPPRGDRGVALVLEADPVRADLRQAEALGEPMAADPRRAERPIPAVRVAADRDVHAAVGAGRPDRRRQPVAWPARV